MLFIIIAKKRDLLGYANSSKLRENIDINRCVTIPGVDVNKIARIIIQYSETYHLSDEKNSAYNRGIE